MPQEKVQVLDKPNPATKDGMKSLLSLSARCLSHQSHLHVGNREVHDKAKLVTERHRYNLESVHMGREHASREKKLSMVNFLIFVQKNVSRIRFQEIKIRP